jgi:hypothetical protein
MSNPETTMLASMTQPLTPANYNAVIRDDAPSVTLVIAGVVFRPDMDAPLNRRWISANGVAMRESRLSDLVEFSTLPVRYIPVQWV